MRVYPVPGRMIRDPVKRDTLPEDGRDVGDTDKYWHRRIADGDATTEDPNAGKPRVPKGAAAAVTTEDRSPSA